MRIDLDPDRLAALKRDYEADAESLAALAARFALSPHALRRIARDMHFAPRPKARPFARKGAPPAPPVAPAPPPEEAPPAARRATALRPLDLGALAQRVRTSVERELGKIHDELEAGADVERRARTLASLVKTLGDLARLEEARAGGKPAAAGPDDDGRPWSMAELQAELARRMERVDSDEPG